MYLWRRQASQKWWSDYKKELLGAAADRLAIIERADRKRLELEVASPSHAELRNLVKGFGGRVLKLPREWLKRFSRQQKTKPIEIRHQKLIIPAGVAFGTGEHATTAMSLRLLEKLTRRWKPGWSIVDLGTGSGILALAGKRFGANRVIGIDNDPTAIATAKENARLNKIREVKFCVADVHHWKPHHNIDIITANLFSELLIQLMPKFKAAHWVILSGILREQEGEVGRALTQRKIDIIEARHRGKWVAILAGRR